MGEGRNVTTESWYNDRMSLTDRIETHLLFRVLFSFPLSYVVFVFAFVFVLFLILVYLGDFIYVKLNRVIDVGK